MRRDLSFADRAHAGSRRFLPALPVLLSVLVLTACGGGAVAHPTGASELVLRVEAGGGFVPVEYNLTQTPSFSLYGDGTVIVTGPMIEIYPQPALPNLQQATITQDGRDKILSAAKDAGLFSSGVDYGIPNVTDLPTTTITITAEGQTYVSDVYALGFEQSIGETLSDDMAVNGLTSEQIEARAAVLDFTVKTGDLDTFLDQSLQWQQYAFDSLAVFSLPVDPGTVADDDSVQPNRLDWPLGDLTTAGEAVQPEGYRRLVVSGADLDDLRPLLDQATQITLWKSGDGEYYLYFRPLLPDENA